MNSEQQNAVVWVLNDGGNDYGPAEAFGPVEFVTKGEYSRVPGSKQNQAVETGIRSWLSKYVPGVDHVVPTGNPMVVALATLHLQKGVGHKFLKWDGRQGEYIPFKLATFDK